MLLKIDSFELCIYWHTINCKCVYIFPNLKVIKFYLLLFKIIIVSEEPSSHDNSILTSENTHNLVTTPSFPTHILLLPSILLYKSMKNLHLQLFLRRVLNWKSSLLDIIFLIMSLVPSLALHRLIPSSPTYKTPTRYTKISLY